MTSKEALFRLQDCGISKIGLHVKLQCIILDDLIKLEKIIGYVQNDEIIPELKVEIIKGIIKSDPTAEMLLLLKTIEE